PIILDELLHFSSRSKVENYKDYLYLTYHLPLYDFILKTSRRVEIDFLITKKQVITIRYEKLELFDAFYRSLGNNKHLKNLALDHDTVRLIYYLIQEIISFSDKQLIHIQESLSYITQEIFKGREELLLQRISYVKRDIMDYSIISRPQEIILKSLADVGKKFWGGNSEVYLNDLIGDHIKTTHTLENHRQVIESLESTNGQLLNAKTNRVMQRFTILAFLTFPIFLVTSILQIDYLAFLSLNLWLVAIGSIVVVVILILIFKNKGWL
ncbi:MAG: CorA family divalent cation transporter, partial [bacterium]|nr:CorA family divalent cation transporter [bacterium]